MYFILRVVIESAIPWLEAVRCLAQQGDLHVLHDTRILMQMHEHADVGNEILSLMHVLSNRHKLFAKLFAVNCDKVVAFQSFHADDAMLQFSTCALVLSTIFNAFACSSNATMSYFYLLAVNTSPALT